NFVTVVSPIEDTPGFRAGIMAGDRILKIDGRGTEKMGLSEAVKNLRGDPDTQVTVTTFRPTTSVTRDLKLTRAVINIDMVKDINSKKEFPLGPDHIGYVRIVQFSEKTGDELEAGLKKLQAQGMQAMVLDLRWNPGGLLDQAVEVCEKFLPRGKLVVTTEGRSPEQSSVRNAGGHGDELVDKQGHPLPMVILVNSGSASAAEIVSGCLQDWKRAIILGDTTFGKGSVQSVIPLRDGAALRLTTAKYYTPSHKVIHEHGITPDISVTTTEDEDRFILLQRMPGGLDQLDDKEKAHFKDYHDPQLDRADDLLKAIILYSQLPEKDQSVPPTRKVAAAN
ncbi:MAG TPA: S41 family peptidase, partial [Pirellulales bacterium]|nr:S41 family peptidase [Pirellulales bacterium]